jgi:glucokinase
MALVDDRGNVLHRVKHSTPTTSSRAVVDAVIAAARECLSTGDLSVSSLGIAVAATVDPKDGILRNAPNLPFLKGVSLAEPIQSELRLPVVTGNDATFAALGEHWIGAGAGSLNAICVTLGTGVGGGLIIDGNVYYGAGGMAGEIGHICVEPEGVKCGCGSYGCLEQYASATATVRIAKELAEASGGRVLSDKDRITALDLFEAASRSEPIAVEAFRVSGRYLGQALAGLVNTLNPEVVIIGGGMAQAWDLFVGETAAEIRKRAFREPAERAKLVRAKLGDDAGIMGAARAAHLSLSRISSTIA